MDSINNDFHSSCPSIYQMIPEQLNSGLTSKKLSPIIKVSKDTHIPMHQIQKEISKMVISKLHNQVKKLNNENISLRNENTLLKDQLTYIIKRMILTKDEYKNPKPKEKYERINHSSLFSPVKDYEINKKSLLETQRIPKASERTSSSIDNKVTSYLNLIYNRHFGNRQNSLDKKMPVYDEIFNREHKLYFNNGNWSHSHLFTDEELDHVFPKNRSQRQIKKIGLSNSNKKKYISSFNEMTLETLNSNLNISGEKKINNETKGNKRERGRVTNHIYKRRSVESKETDNKTKENKKRFSGIMNKSKIN